MQGFREPNVGITGVCAEDDCWMPVWGFLRTFSDARVFNHVGAKR